MRRNQVILNFLLLALIFTTLQCGGSSSGTSSETGTNAESSVESQVQASVSGATTTAMQISAVANLSSLPPSLAAAEISELEVAQDCSGGGSMVIDIPDTQDSITMSYTDCVLLEGDDTILDGIFSATWEIINDDYFGSITFDDFSVQDDTGTVTSDGTITLEYSTTNALYTYVFDLSGTDVNSATMTLEGELTVTEDSIANGSITSSYLGATYSCTFTNFDLENATEAQWAAACSL
jgi:hypothetical protein